MLTPTRRKRMVVYGLVGAAVVVLSLGLFTRIGTSAISGPPQAGDTAPTFSLPGLNVTGRVGTPASGGRTGKPVVVLFMGDWCSICRSEIPSLAATITRLRSHHSALAHLAVIGVDSEDTPSDALSFVKSAGVTFPVGADTTAHVMNGLYGFEGDPYAVFVEGSGRIMIIHPGPLSAAQFLSLERKLLAT